jgi:AcrR family transcriptional regulator
MGVFAYVPYSLLPGLAAAMKNDGLSPRKTPRQRRSAVTVEVIVEAATRILASHGLAGFNTNRVAELAGVSVGSLYQYFPNKAALVAALIERAQNGLADALEVAVAAHLDKPLRDALAALVDIAVAYQYGNPLYAAALDDQELRLPLGEMIDHPRARMLNTVASLLTHYQQVLPQTLPAAAAADCLNIAKTLIESAPERAACDLSTLKRRVLRALLGYLQYVEE